MNWTTILLIEIGGAILGYLALKNYIARTLTKEERYQRENDDKGLQTISQIKTLDLENKVIELFIASLFLWPFLILSWLAHFIIEKP